MSKHFLPLLIIIGLLLMLIQQNGIAFWQRRQVAFDTAAFYAERRYLQAALNTSERKLEQQINEFGQQETKVVALEQDKEGLKQMLSAQDRFLVNKLAQFEVKLKDLKSVTNLRVETSGQFVTVTRDSIASEMKPRAGDASKTDTVRQTFKVINYREANGWFDMSGVIQGDTMSFKPVFYNEFDIATYRERAPKRYWLDLFPPKRTVAKVIDRNPYSRTQEFKTIVKAERKRFLGIF